MKTWMTMTLAAMMAVAIPACTAQTDSSDPDEGAESAESAESAAGEDTGESAEASTGLHRYCTTSGSADSGWTYSGIPGYYDFGRSRISWSASSVDGVGTINITGTIDGVTYGPLPNTIALTGAILVNGNNVPNCPAVSTVDRDGNATATATRSCSMSWSGNTGTTTVKLQDSPSGARFEFIRGTVNDQFYGLTSGSSTTTCWWG